MNIENKKTDSQVIFSFMWLQASQVPGFAIGVSWEAEGKGDGRDWEEKGGVNINFT